METRTRSETHHPRPRPPAGPGTAASAPPPPAPSPAASRPGPVLNSDYQFFNYYPFPFIVDCRNGKSSIAFFLHAPFCPSSWIFCLTLCFMSHHHKRSSFFRTSRERQHGYRLLHFRIFPAGHHIHFWAKMRFSMLFCWPPFISQQATNSWQPNILAT